jgi:hypothetical protein
MSEGNGGYEVIQLDTLNGGQIVALFDREFSKILENVADENTPEKAVRSLKIEIKIKPEEGRGSAVVEVSAQSKLAAVKPSKSFAVFAFDGDKVTAYQSDPKQLSLGVETPPANEVEEKRRAAAGGS